MEAGFAFGSCELFDNDGNSLSKQCQYNRNPGTNLSLIRILRLQEQWTKEYPFTTAAYARPELRSGEASIAATSFSLLISLGLRG